jgi:hypothetical protein
MMARPHEIEGRFARASRRNGNSNDQPSHGSETKTAKRQSWHDSDSRQDSLRSVLGRVSLLHISRPANAKEANSFSLSAASLRSLASSGLRRRFSRGRLDIDILREESAPRGRVRSRPRRIHGPAECGDRAGSKTRRTAANRRPFGNRRRDRRPSVLPALVLARALRRSPLAGRSRAGDAGAQSAVLTDAPFSFGRNLHFLSYPSSAWARYPAKHRFASTLRRQTANMKSLIGFNLAIAALANWVDRRRSVCSGGDSAKVCEPISFSTRWHLFCRSTIIGDGSGIFTPRTQKTS